MSKNIIMPKKKLEPSKTENIEELIIQKMSASSQNTEGVEDDDIDNPQRVNFMMPRYLYDIMKTKLKKKGDKMSNYLISLVRKDLGDD
jgi:hypothetical protein